ncbi:MAG: TetR/AcrR family transcriptional regulator [Bacteroidetes bacterium]|nr:TetR/AcrR family transcriptional regulator [Bacteroidota bacterium]
MALNKEDIIKKSVIVFKNRGYNATSISDIAKECGILKGSLYHHFSSKHELMKEVLSFLKTYFAETVFSIAYNENLTIEKRLEKLSRKSEEQFMEGIGGCFMSLIGNECVTSNMEFNAIVKDFFAEWKNAFTHLYSNFYGQKQANEMAERAIMLIEGAVLLMRIHNNPDFLTNAQNWLINDFKNNKILIKN